MLTRPAPLLVLFAVLASACTDDPSAPVALQPPPGAPGGGGVLVECRADVGAARMACAPVAPGAGGASADLILGGQGTYVQLANDSIAVGAGVFSTRVTVQNLTVQPMGTLDGAAVSPRGVRVFFHQGPTNGVEVANEDGVEMYTAAAQPYFQYDGILQPQQVSAGRRWSFDLNGETESFSFQVLVIAEVPSETGFLRMEQVAGAVIKVPPNDMWMDENTVVAVVGEVVYRSLDGGRQWMKLSNVAGYLYSVWGHGSTLVGVGWRGQIQRSTNRGDTWQGISSGTRRSLVSVWGDHSTFIAVGDTGTILRSTDDGVTWERIPSGTTSALHDVWGDGATVMAVGSGGTILRSTNGGSTWATVASGTSRSLYNVWGEGNTFVAGGDYGTGETCETRCATVVRSTNGGATWTRATLGSANSISGLWGQGSVVLATIGPGSAAEPGGTIFKSVDGGAIWHQVIYARSAWQNMTGVAGYGSTVIALGLSYSSIVLRSSNLGSTWEDIQHGDYPTLYDAWGEGTTVVAVGGVIDYRNYDEELRRYYTIRRSVDAGATWHEVMNGGAGFLHGVWGDGSTVVAVGDSGTILRSTDGGATWDSVSSGTTDWLQDVHGNGTTVVVVGGNGTILRSTNGGQTFDRVASATTAGLGAVWGDGSTFVAVGGTRTILRSTDGGAAWTTVASPVQEALRSVWGEGSILVAVGEAGTIVRSTDGGGSWSPVNSGTTQRLFDVSGSGSTMVGVGWEGTLLRSTNGGAAWHALSAPANHHYFFGVWMASAENAIVVGSSGAILRSTR